MGECIRDILTPRDYLVENDRGGFRVTVKNGDIRVYNSLGLLVLELGNCLPENENCLPKAVGYWYTGTSFIAKLSDEQITHVSNRIISFLGEIGTKFVDGDDDKMIYGDNYAYEVGGPQLATYVPIYGIGSFPGTRIPTIKIIT